MAEEVMSQVSTCAVSSKSRGVVLSALIDAHGESNVLRYNRRKTRLDYGYENSKSLDFLRPARAPNSAQSLAYTHITWLFRS
jgi:hypothetical protein